MSVYIEPGYTLPGADQPQTHARIAHKGNWFENVIATPSSTATGYSASGPMGLTSFETWRPYDNLLTAPTDWSDAAWTKNRVTIEGFRIQEDSTASNTHEIADNVTFGTGPHVLTVDAKAGEREFLRLVFLSGAGGPSEVGARFFDLRSGAVLTGDDTTGTVTHLGGGVYRCKIVFTPAAGAGSIRIRLASDATTDSYTGDGISGLFVYRAFLSRADSTYNLDLRAAKQADYICIGAHNLGSAGATVAIQYDNSGFETVGIFTPTDDSPIYFMMEPETRQEWRLSITNASEPTIGNIKIGKALQLPRPVNLQSHAPWEFQRQTTLRTNYSATGEILGRRVQAVRNETEYSINNVPAAWVRTNWPSFQRAAEEAPIYVAWRPNGTYPGVSFGECPAVPQASHTGPRDLMGLSFSLTGPGYE